MSTWNDYVNNATQQYDPEYNAAVQAKKNQLAQTLTGYNNQKVSTNQSYDGQVDTQNTNNTLTKNNYNNNTLNRGLGRSTIFTSGVAGLDDKNTRLVGDINQNRTNAIGTIDNNIASANTAYNGDLSTLATDRMNKINTLARQLQQTDIDNAYKQQQLDLQRQSEARAAAQAAATAKAQQQAAQNPWDVMGNVLKQYGYGGMISWLQDNKYSLISSVGEGEYYNMRKYATGVQESMRQNYKEKKMAKSW